MHIDKLNELKAQCAAVADFDPVKGRVTTKAQATKIYYFWLGALYALDETTNPYVVICLASGRYADLCTPKPPAKPKHDLVTVDEATSVVSAGVQQHNGQRLLSKGPDL